MMKKTILAAIAAINAKSEAKIADWRLVGAKISRQELYFIRERTEQLRAVDELRYSLTVYVDSEADGKKFRGEATVGIQPSHTQAEVEAKIEQALFAASKSKNAWFDLPGPARAKISLPASGFEGLDPDARIEALRSALYAPEAGAASGEGSAEGAPKPRINSLELFLSKEEKAFANSKGLEFSGLTWRGYSEFVVEADSARGPVELFDDIEFSDPDAERLSEATGSRLAQVGDRALATPLPSLSDIPVILSGREAEDLFAWFFGNSTTSAIFTKASPFSLGAYVQAADKGGEAADPLDMWAEPYLSGLAASAPFDADGFPLERTQVIQGGYLRNLVGAIRYADWLGVERKGSFPLFSVSPGTMPLAEMRAKPYLEPVMFSDFRLDPVTGDFGAEMRLAYWFDGEKRRPVTGGSISGSVTELSPTMRRSIERGLATRSLCPKAVLLRGVSISGIGE